jgi:uncharacterized protein YbjT (DUF2867 family)
MITILGAGGAISNELVKLLAAQNHAFRLAGRNPQATSGATCRDVVTGHRFSLAREAYQIF